MMANAMLLNLLMYVWNLHNEFVKAVYTQVFNIKNTFHININMIISNSFL